MVNSDFYNDDIETKIYETQNFNHYMIDVFPEFNIETSEIELKCNTLPSAVFLFMINNKKRLKICEECSSLFGGKKVMHNFVVIIVLKRIREKEILNLYIWKGYNFLNSIC